MVPRDVCDGDLIFRTYSEQVSVLNQVVRMFVVLVVIDVVTDIVEHGSVGQDLAILALTSQPCANGVEQLQRKLLNVFRVRPFKMCSFGELPD